MNHRHPFEFFRFCLRRERGTLLIGGGRNLLMHIAKGCWVVFLPGHRLCGARPSRSPAPSCPFDANRASYLSWRRARRCLAVGVGPAGPMSQLATARGRARRHLGARERPSRGTSGRSPVPTGNTCRILSEYRIPVHCRVVFPAAGQLVSTPPIEERWGTALLMACSQRSRPGEQW